MLGEANQLSKCCFGLMISMWLRVVSSCLQLRDPGTNPWHVPMAYFLSYVHLQMVSTNNFLSREGKHREENWGVYLWKISEVPNPHWASLEAFGVNSLLTGDLFLAGTTSRRSVWLQKSALPLSHPSNSFHLDEHGWMKVSISRNYFANKISAIATFPNERW